MIIDISKLQIVPHPQTKNWIIVYEPLAVDLPESAHPYCCYANHVIFYQSKDDRTILAETDHKIRYSLHGNTILKYGNKQFMLMTGKVIYHNNQWCVEWVAHKTTGLLEEGGTGFWCQGECVFIQADHGTAAIDKYRQKLADADIGISCHLPEAIDRRNAYERLARIEQVLCLAEEALTEVHAQEDWKSVGKALEQIRRYRSL